MMIEDIMWIVVNKKCKLIKVLGTFYRYISFTAVGARWLSGRVLDSRLRGRGLEPHRCHCIVVLEQDTFILA